MSFDPYRARFSPWAPPAPIDSPEIVESSDIMPPEVASAIHALARAVLNTTGRPLTHIRIDASVPQRFMMATSAGVVDVQFAPQGKP